MVTAKLPLTQEERARIHEAVAATERRTSAVFSLVIVPVSDRYALFPVVWAAVLALLATGIAALLWPKLGIRIGFAIDAAVFAILVIIFDWLPLRLRIVPKAVKHSQARRLAQGEFAVRIVGASHRRNGVLFFVSLGERYVEVIADRNIHSRVASDTWDRLVGDFIAAVKAGRLAQGFVAAVESCGDILETHYPETAASVIPERRD
jgi:putative membrane protein